MIADDARLTPPRCKKHTAYDDSRLTPHCCKKHTASFPRSTGKFPSHTIIRAAFVCVCSLSPPRSFDGSSPNLVGVCRWTSELPLRGSFSKRSTGQRVTFAFHYIIYVPASLHTLQRHLLLGKQQSNSAHFAVLHVNDVCRWTWQLLLRGSFSKRSTGRRVNGSLSLSLYYIL